MQILWARRDRLATNELYALGKAIKRLQPMHQQWLVSTAETLKKDPATSHGYITEILTCGSTQGVGGAEVRPAKKGKPGYDFSIWYPSGFRFLVSVKNHDISVHEKAFVEACDQLRSALIERLAMLGKNGRLVVQCADFMTPEIFLACQNYIKVTLRETGQSSLLDGRLTLTFSELLNKAGREFAPTKTSNLLIVWGKHHHNEQPNFRSKLKAAADNMKKHVPRSDDYARMLFMRVHFTADIEALESIAKEMIEAQWDCGFDFIALTQSAGARTAEGRSCIHTVACFAGSSDHQGLMNAAKRGDRFVYELGIGTAGKKRLKSHLMMDGDILEHPAPSCYEYQQGDFYYIVAVNGERADIGSPATGIRTHAVANFNGREVVFSTNSPDSENVLIV